MRVSVGTDPSQTLADYGPTLELHEAENGLMLGRLSAATNGTVAAALMPGGELGLLGFLSGSPPQGGTLVLSHGSLEAAGPLALQLFARGVELQGVNGPTELSTAFAEQWMLLKRIALQITADMTLYRLDAPPVLGQLPPGELDEARPQEVDLLAEWIRDFSLEAIPSEAPSLAMARVRARQGIDTGTLFVWRQAGEVTSMAGWTRPTRRGITINLVYTPPALRRQGLASAVAAGISQRALENGKEFCTLFADVSNPTSNSIYRKMGYRPILAYRTYAIASS